MSVELTQGVLQELMQGAVTAALQANRESVVQTRVKHAERPEVDVGYSESQWAFFIDEWRSYKRRTALPAEKVVHELRASCTKELRKIIFNLVGGNTLETIPEHELLEKIKSSAVIGKNQAVHRKEFYSLRQSPGEHINFFVARLRAKAEHCNFILKCSNGACENQSNSYADAMIIDQITTGILDKDIQEELLAKDKTLKTFQERYDLIEAYELGKLAKGQLDVEDSSINAVKSTYKRMQDASRTQRFKDQNTTSKARCVGCGATTHTSSEREQNCPAWNKNCYNCKTPHHFSKVCLKRKSNLRRSATEPTAAASATTNTIEELFATDTSSFFTFSEDLKNTPSIEEHVLPHVEWDGKKFCRSKPPPLPRVDINVNLMVDTHKLISKTPSSRARSCTMSLLRIRVRKRVSRAHKFCRKWTSTKTSLFRHRTG